ncbi:unnamed protein product [Echinostoma caproni]|uniref:Uncharacterized protein n=1 Tax=Echinostoma caproni TaxID=27848 RepID=A0A183A9D1_9TREM|nr:unnamed protein product [Echinostoma caproni]
MPVGKKARQQTRDNHLVVLPGIHPPKRRTCARAHIHMHTNACLRIDTINPHTLTRMHSLVYTESCYHLDKRTVALQQQLSAGLDCCRRRRCWCQCWGVLVSAYGANAVVAVVVVVVSANGGGSDGGAVGVDGSE